MEVIQLTQLATYDLNRLIPSENNVKYQIVIPFLQSFGHKELTFEHAAQGSRVDINIGSKIVVETKALNQNLDSYIQQLSDYCGREWPVLALLTNGRDFRIYSPLWRRKSNFQDKIIYAFSIAELKNEQLLYRLDKIIGKENYESEKFFENISQREKELLDVERKIENLRRVQNASTLDLAKEIANLKEQVQNLNSQLLQKEKALSEVESGKISGVEELLSELFVPQIRINPRPIVPPPPTPPPSGTEPTYIKRYRKMLKNPESLPSRMKRYIDDVGSLSWSELKKACVQRLGCKSETSGSIGASLRVLELDGHVRTIGRSETRKIISNRMAP